MEPPGGGVGAEGCVKAKCMSRILHLKAWTNLGPDSQVNLKQIMNLHKKRHVQTIPQRAGGASGFLFNQEAAHQT